MRITKSSSPAWADVPTIDTNIATTTLIRRQLEK
jgi:hypothetical protein